ncbi:MAG: sensor histidine kinase, partial [Thermaceae bacterium]
MGTEGLYRLVRLAQRFLPIAILAVVVFFEISLLPYRHQDSTFWLRLGFYGLLGPLVTFAALEWIAQEIKERAKAEEALQEANRRLFAVGRVFQEALQAETLEEAVSRIAQALTQVLGYPVTVEVQGV